MLGFLLIILGIIVFQFAANSLIYVAIGIALIWWGVSRLASGGHSPRSWGMDSGNAVSEELTGEIVQQILELGTYEHFEFRVRPSGSQSSAHELICTRGSDRGDASERQTYSYRFSAHNYRNGSPHEQQALLRAIKSYLPYGNTYTITTRGAGNTQSYVMDTCFYIDKRWNPALRTWEYR